MTIFRDRQQLLVFIISSLAVLSAPETNAAQNDKENASKPVFVPDPDRCTLEMDGVVLKPIRVLPEPKRDQVIGGLRVEREKGTIAGYSPGTDKPKWTAPLGENVEIEWLGSDDQIAYLAGFTKDEKTERWKSESPLRVRRLDLTWGEWLPDLPVGGTPGEDQAEYMLGLLVRRKQAIVLVGTVATKHAGFGHTPLVRSSIMCFDGVELTWSKEFPSVGGTLGLEPMLLGFALNPTKTRPSVQRLNWLGDDVLFCPDPWQPLTCLKKDTGEKRWSLSRLWEYQRGFIGPSVWQHVLTRFGESDFPDEKEKEREEDNRKMAGSHSIAAGPVIVELPPDSRGRRKRSIFVATANGPERYADFVSNCVLYELDADGDPIAVANLPRMVRGGEFAKVDDGVVWACEGGAFVKAIATRERHAGIGPGGPDRLCRVEWYRQLSFTNPGAWLSSDPANDLIAFENPFAYRVIAGGFVMEPDSKLYQFPISRVELKSGLDRTMLLKVPLQEKCQSRNRIIASQLPRKENSLATLGDHICSGSRRFVLPIADCMSPWEWKNGRELLSSMSANSKPRQPIEESLSMRSPIAVSIS